VEIDTRSLGFIGQVHPDVCESWGIETDVYAAELDFDAIEKLERREVRFVHLPKFPAIVRDFAMVVEDSLPVGELEKCIKQNAGELLEKAELFDVYRGAPILPGFKSVAFSLSYRSADRTLKEGEVNEINERVLSALKDKYKVVLRDI
jgi:phenylalanyl-tRNA synthetase beta chain